MATPTPNTPCNTPTRAAPVRPHDGPSMCPSDPSEALTLSHRTSGSGRTCIRGRPLRRRSKSTSKPGRRPAQRPVPGRLPNYPSWPTHLWGKQGQYGQPASQSVSANWPRLAEAGGRPELDLALAGRAGGRVGRSLCAAVFHIATHRAAIRGESGKRVGHCPTDRRTTCTHGMC